MWRMVMTILAYSFAFLVGCSAPSPPATSAALHEPPAARSEPDTRPSMPGAPTSSPATPAVPSTATTSTEAEVCGKGSASQALVSAVRARLAEAKSCHLELLRKGDKEGRLILSLAIGADGSTRGVSILDDELKSPDLEKCLKEKFRNQTYPPPARGCVVINAPLNFMTKQADPEPPSDGNANENENENENENDAR